MIKGISGGERKRLSVAIELINKPKILFLDEPTSGLALDSFGAKMLIEILKDIARERNSIICCTIHQPSSEIFDCFDRTICLRNGNVIASGPKRQVVEPRGTTIEDEQQ